MAQKRIRRTSPTSRQLSFPFHRPAFRKMMEAIVELSEAYLEELRWEQSAEAKRTSLESPLSPEELVELPTTSSLVH